MQNDVAKMVATTSQQPLWDFWAKNNNFSVPQPQNKTSHEKVP
jgi:hypothetical protein